MQNISAGIALNISEQDEQATNRSLAATDIIDGFKNYKLWHYLAMTEMRRRYRRTIIGPFWTTLSIGIFIACMSVVLSAMWGSSPKAFLPYFSAGYITWMLFSTLVTEGTTTFIVNEGYLKQLSIPYIIYACLTTWRNFIIFAHHLIIFALVLLYCQYPININLLFIIPGIIITFFTGVWVCLLLGMLCARYRDVQQIITSLLQLTMFVTPIMWKPAQLGAKGLIITKYNPIYHYISVIRMPLLGESPPLTTWLITIALSSLLALVTFGLFSKKYRTIIYWL